jgi:hypothetical protein
MTSRVVDVQHQHHRCRLRTVINHFVAILISKRYPLSVTAAFGASLEESNAVASTVNRPSRRREPSRMETG